MKNKNYLDSTRHIYTVFKCGFVLRGGGGVEDFEGFLIIYSCSLLVGHIQLQHCLTRPNS